MSHITKTSVLMLVPYYYPGYRAGGALRATVNLIDWIGDQHDIYLLTRDRDLADTQPYTQVGLGRWQPVGNAQVRYEPTNLRDVPRWLQIVRSTPYDVLVLGSLFFHMNLFVLFLHHFRLLPRARRVVLVPHGMLSSGAIALKSRKKRLLVALIKFLGIHRAVTWQATTDLERGEIEAVFGETMPNIEVVPYLPPKPDPDMVSEIAESVPKEAGMAKLVFLSRISPKKNLDYALRLLAQVQQRIQFDIYGPVEEKDYWETCQRLIADLPSHIEVAYHGAIPHEEVVPTLASYHGFLLPTRSENYGFVFAEALAAGTLLIISDQTPWRNLQDQQLGWDLPLDDMPAFVRAVEELATMSAAQFATLSARARRFDATTDHLTDTLQRANQLLAVPNPSAASAEESIHP